MIYVSVGLVVFFLYISIVNVVTVYFYALSIKSSCIFSFGRGGRAGGYKEFDEEEIEDDHIMDSAHLGERSTRVKAHCLCGVSLEEDHSNSPPFLKSFGLVCCGIVSSCEEFSHCGTSTS